MTHDNPISSGDESVNLERDAVAFFESLQQTGASCADHAELAYGSVRFVLGLPPLGEGDRGIVYPLRSSSLNISDSQGRLCLKVAKQQPICRQRLLEEVKTTEFFLGEDLAVPRIHFMDALGRFCVKDFIEGESITSLYLRFASLPTSLQSQILAELERYLSHLLLLFQKRPDCKVSISPNNIYVLTEGERFALPLRFVLIDPGLVPKKNYDGFNFQHYWNEVLPDRIRKYQKTGYLQWLVPRKVTHSEKEEAKQFEIFRGMNPAEIFLLLKIARTIEFDTEDIIVREGAIGENFYLILDGEVELRKGHYVKPGALTVRIGSGSVLGEMAFLLHVPRSMTAVAATPCKLIEIDRDQFNELLDSNLTAPYKLIRNIATILAERLYATDATYQRLVECQAELAKEGSST